MSKVLTESKVGTLKVNAKGDGVTYTDSNWLMTMNYQFVKDDIETNDYVNQGKRHIDNKYSLHIVLAGGIAGWASSSTISNCNGDFVICVLYEGNHNEGSTSVGGLFGYCEMGNLYNCEIKGSYKA